MISGFRVSILSDDGHMVSAGDRWRRISDVYHAALERDLADRPDFIAAACAGDDLLRREIESLLQSEGTTVSSDVNAPRASASEGEEPRGILAGHRLGSYQLGSLLGAGGMGEVYAAHDPRLMRDVAIKVVHAALAADPERV